MLLNRGLRGTIVFRTLFFLPNLTPAVAAALLWIWLLAPEVGPVNYAARRASASPGRAGSPSPQWALPSIVAHRPLGRLGRQHDADLPGRPAGRAAGAATRRPTIDGAGGWPAFRHVTLPMISPTIFFNLVLGIIGALQGLHARLRRDRGRAGLRDLVLRPAHLPQGVRVLRDGLRLGAGLDLRRVLLVFTLVQIRLARRWVYYAGRRPVVAATTGRAARARPRGRRARAGARRLGAGRRLRAGCSRWRSCSCSRSSGRSRARSRRRRDLHLPAALAGGAAVGELRRACFDAVAVRAWFRNSLVVVVLGTVGVLVSRHAGRLLVRALPLPRARPALPGHARRR